MSTDELPVLLVAAKDSAAANKIISELIEKEESADNDSQCIWEISNKYYSARVLLQAVCDEGPATPVGGVEALVVYLAHDECSAETLTRRATRARGAGGAGDVRLALADCQPDHHSESLQAAALQLDLELVPLRAGDPASGGDGAGEAEAEGPFPARLGLARAREALHTHAWPGLRPARAAHLGLFTAWADADEADEGSDSSGGDGGGEGGADSEPEPDAAECVRRAERLADVLRAAEGVRAGAGGGGGGEGGAAREERLLRAEQLVAAFCRALGADPHDM